MPIIIDGVDTLVRLFVVLIWGRNFHEHNIPYEELPKVTVLIPAYNEEQVIDRCLNSIKIQDYPHEKLEVVVINDGSTDYTAERVMNHINGGFNGNGFNGNGFKNGANGGTNGGHKNGTNGGTNGGYKNGTNGGTNGGNHNGNARLPDGQGFNGNGFNGNGYGYRLPYGIYSTRDFRNGNGANGGTNGGMQSQKSKVESQKWNQKNGTNGGANGGHKNGTNGGTNGGHKNGANGGNHNGNGHNGNGFNGNGYLKINGDTIPVPPFNGDITLISNGHIGKPKALNLGINHMNHSDIVITIDSDVVLAPGAIRNMASAFAENPKMGAATGHIEISSDILEERDEYGNLVLDEEGKLITKKLAWWESLLARCQFLEYLDAFRLGRQFQATVHSTYILAGAFSAFRRDVLEASPLYRTRTVSEDFDLTADIHRTKTHIGYVADAKALLEPVTAWDQLFSQRVRWCRGQLEVCGAHQEMIGNRKFGPMGWFGLPHMLVVDHTLAFPRLIWTLLLLLFPLFGYPVMTIAMAIAFMYLFYVGLSFLQTFSAYTIVDEDTKRQTEKSLAYCFILPIYRLVTFYFRMSGYLKSLREPSAWEVAGPLNAITNGVNGFKNGLNGFTNGVKNGFHNGYNGINNGLNGGSSNGTVSRFSPIELATNLGGIIRDFKVSLELLNQRIYHTYATNGGSKTIQGRIIKEMYIGFDRLRDILSRPKQEEPPKPNHGNFEKATDKKERQHLREALSQAKRIREKAYLKLELSKTYFKSRQFKRGVKELNEALVLGKKAKIKNISQEIGNVAKSLPIKYWNENLESTVKKVLLSCAWSSERGSPRVDA